MFREQGVITIIDPTARQMETNIDTVTCAHCNRVYHVLPGQNASDVGGRCKGCMKLVCAACAGKSRCEPWEKQLDLIEARAAATGPRFQRLRR